MSFKKVDLIICAHTWHSVSVNGHKQGFEVAVPLVYVHITGLKFTLIHHHKLSKNDLSFESFVCFLIYDFFIWTFQTPLYGSYQAFHTITSVPEWATVIGNHASGRRKIIRKLDSFLFKTSWLGFFCHQDIMLYKKSKRTILTSKNTVIPLNLENQR